MKNLKYRLKLLLICLLITLATPWVQAQERGNETPAEEIDIKHFPAAVKEKADKAKHEALAYLLQAIAHTKSPQEYRVGRNDLAAHLVPVIKNMESGQRSRLQEIAFDIFINEAKRQRLLGSHLSKVDFKRPIYDQIQDGAVLSKNGPIGEPKTSNASEAGSGQLKFGVRKVVLADGSVKPATSEDLLIGVLFIAPDECITKSKRVNISGLTGRNSLNKIVQSYAVEPSRKRQSFYANIMLFGSKDEVVIDVLSVILNYATPGFKDDNRGLVSFLSNFSDLLIGDLVSSNGINSFFHEVGINGNSCKFSDNYHFRIKRQEGAYNVHFNWSYYNPNCSGGKGEDLPENLELADVYIGKDGATYYLASSAEYVGGNPQIHVAWYGEHPDGNFTNVFRGYRVGNIINGTWADTPNGKGNSSGTLKVEIVKTIIGNILKPVSQTGGFSCKEWWPANPPANPPGKKPAYFSGGIGNMDGLWTCDDGGVYYFNQVGNTLYWYGQQNINSGKPNFANIGKGSITSNSITLYWWDVPKGKAKNHGYMTLKKVGDHMVKKGTGFNFSGTTWTRIPETVMPSCKPINFAQLSVKSHARGGSVYMNGQTLFAFTDVQQAEWAYNVLKLNHITSICTIGKGNKRTRFLLRNNEIPDSPASTWENCVSFIYKFVKVKKTRTGFMVTDGKNLNLEFDTEADANTVKKMIFDKKATKYCKVGNSFDYWRR